MTPTMAPVERMGTGDLMTLAADLGTPPMQIAGILVLEGGSALDVTAARAAIAERVRGIHRFRQRLVHPPPGLGRPYWTDAPDFAVGNHFRHVACPVPGDDDALLAVATEAVTQRLDRERPLWSVTFVTGLAGGAAALVFVVHHVLTDGIGGLGVLARIADGMPVPDEPGFPRPVPGFRQLLTDSARDRLVGLRHLGAVPGRIRAALHELRLRDTASAPPSSLNRRTGPRRRFAVARADATAVRTTARAHGGMVNDAVLAAATGALHGLLSHRGETVSSLVVSMPVSTRGRDAGAHLGNHAFSVPIELPAAGHTLDRLATIAWLTHNRVGTARGASAALVSPLFRVLARLKLLQWFVDHQTVLSTSITYLRGPATRLSFLGTPIREVIPLSTVKGNMTVSFVALSYAARLTVTAVTDPDQVTDLPVLMAALERELATLAVPAVPAAGQDGPKSPRAGTNGTGPGLPRRPTVEPEGDRARRQGSQEGA
ncbi:wax ester/triacylglycerol synthase domain-containing protein [Saccharomonospora sp. NPDC046836]|uniref:wax ester/triacylglycerol synthase domain-containing protein n=1 Tax=Saccharomonospora sp. NPDC046836 TaxID=3156921 RepID=UPI0033CFBC6D